MSCQPRGKASRQPHHSSDSLHQTRSFIKYCSPKLELRAQSQQYISNNLTGCGPGWLCFGSPCSLSQQDIPFFLETRPSSGHFCKLIDCCMTGEMPRCATLATGWTIETILRLKLRLLPCDPPPNTLKHLYGYRAHRHSSRLVFFFPAKLPIFHSFLSSY